MKRLISAAVAVIMTFSGFSVLASDNKQSEELTEIRNFMGVSNRVYESDKILNGWERIDISWSDLEPRFGVFDEEELEKAENEIKSVSETGRKVLVLITGTPVWAVETMPYSFIKDGNEYNVGRLRGIKYEKVVRSVGEKNGDEMQQEELIISPENIRLNKNGAEEWKKFVKYIGEKLKGMTDYIQIYDEPFGKAENFYGSESDYLEEIHKPAAKILQDMGYKVVCGGIPNNYDTDVFLKSLKDNDAFSSIDVFNVYNATTGGLNYLYNQIKAMGIVPYIWQTETGYLNATTYTANNYLRTFYWSLLNKEAPDQFKVFWSEKQDNDTETTLCEGDYGELTQYGKSYNGIINLLSGKNVEIFKDYTNKYGMEFEIFETKSSSEAFLVDNKRVVIANHMVVQNTAGMYSGPDGDSMHTGFSNSFLDMNVYGAKGDYTTKRYTIFGSGWEIPNLKGEDGSIVLLVPVSDTLAAPATSLEETAEAIAANRRDRALTFFTVIDAESFETRGENINEE